MIHSIFEKLLRRRHFWRYATFSEIAELYASRMLRTLAINMSAAFMAVYLYQIGYSVLFIVGYWIAYFLLRAVFAFPSGMLVGWLGPKHGILISNLLYIPSMISFVFVDSLGIGAIITTGVLQAFSIILYEICYQVNFSKIKNIEHAGKEMAYMNMFEKVAAGLSPLIGGLLAFVAGPQATMWAAAVLFTCAAAPLLKTSEQVITRRIVSLWNLPWRQVWRSLVAQTVVGFDVVASGNAWSFYVAIALIGVTSNVIYAQIGIFTTVTLLAALSASYAYGRVIDRNKGGDLLRFSVIANGIIHVSRPFASTPLSIMMINATNEAATAGYSMAFTRGTYDMADATGNRTGYLTLICAVTSFGAAVAVGILFTLIAIGGTDMGYQLFYVVIGVLVLGINSARFPLYRK